MNEKKESEQLKEAYIKAAEETVEAVRQLVEKIEQSKNK